MPDTPRNGWSCSVVIHKSIQESVPSGGRNTDQHPRIGNRHNQGWNHHACCYSCYWYEGGIGYMNSDATGIQWGIVPMRVLPVNSFDQQENRWGSRRGSWVSCATRHPSCKWTHRESLTHLGCEEGAVSVTCWGCADVISYTLPIIEKTALQSCFLCLLEETNPPTKSFSTKSQE